VAKFTKQEETPDSQKKARIAENPDSFNNRKAAWHLGRIQMAAPYGWQELTLKEVDYIRSKLALFEKNTWNQIFVEDKKRNHPIEVSALKCIEAKRWMKQNMPDQPTLWTLRLAGAERIWGIYSEGAYQILFWDPKHLIYPTAR
jgi:hypothetical protein